MNDLPPPHDPQAEAAVLGAVLHGAADAALSLCPEDFYVPAYSRVFGAAMRLHQEGKPVDQVTVASLLDGDDKFCVLDVAGGYVPSSITHHVAMVKDLSRRRAAIRECVRITAAAYESDSEEVTADALQCFMRLQDTGTKGSVSIADIVESRLSSLTDSRPFFTFYKGAPHVKAGNFIVIGGRPATGKSALALAWAYELSRAMRVAFFSYEMDADELADRLISAKTSYSIESLDIGCSPFEVGLMCEKMTDIAKHKLSVKVSAGLSVPQLLSSLRTFRAGGGQVAFIDYIQLAIEHTKHGDTHDVTVLSNALRRLALDTGLTIVALSQFNRGMEGRSGKDAYPKMSDFRQSGALEQDATHAALLYAYPHEFAGEVATGECREAREKLREQGWEIVDVHDPRRLVRLDWAKVRQGSQRLSLFWFDGSKMQFEEVQRV